MKTTFDTFCGVTTVHGFRALRELKKKWQRILWSLIILGTFTGLTFHFWFLIDSYLEYQITESSTESTSGYEFPGRLFYWKYWTESHDDF